jgi:hypothetical protein
MSAYWPNTLPEPQHVFSQSNRFDTVRTPFESGKVQTFAKWVSGRESFTLVWNAIHEEDRKVLVDHWEDRKGGAESFVWVHPLKATIHTVRFSEDALTQEYIGTDYWKIGLTIEEV